MNTDSNVNGPFKLIIIGDSGVGKSSIIRYLVYKKFSNNIESTIGSSFYRYTSISDKNDRIVFDIWDTAGQERFRSIISLYMRNSDIIIFTYDRSSRESFNSLIQYWIPMINNHYNNQDKMPIRALIENKTDLCNDEELSKIAEEYASQNDLIYAQTSCRYGTGIIEFFNQLSIILRDKLPINNKKKSSNETIKINPFNTSKNLWDQCISMFYFNVK